MYVVGVCGMYLMYVWMHVVTYMYVKEAMFSKAVYDHPRIGVVVLRHNVPRLPIKIDLHK